MKEQKTVLVVDDEQNIRDIIDAYLEREGYKVLQAEDGEKAIEYFENEPIDLIILDLMMPLMSGIEVCEKIRLVSMVPIIMLTARVSEEEVITGLKQGADDYVKKPFSARELVVRVENLLRRTSADKPLLEIYQYNDGDLTVNFNAMKVCKKGKTLILTPNEFKILQTFIQNPNIVLSREQIIELTFGIDFDGYDRTIDTHIKNLRAKIEDLPKKPKYIQTVYSMGYKFCVNGA